MRCLNFLTSVFEVFMFIPDKYGQVAKIKPLKFYVVTFHSKKLNEAELSKYKQN